MKKKISIILVAVVAALVLFTGYKTFLAPKGTQGTKKVTIQVINKGQNFDKTYTFKTDDQFLYDLLKENEKKLGATFKDFSFGPMVTGFNGYVAQDSKKEYFAMKINDKDAMTGVKETPINDGDKFVFELKTY